MRTYLDTEALRVFMAVAEAESFSIAAEHLHVTQSAVSKRIAQLEHELGQLLFNRLGRQLSLTEAGRVLVAKTPAILDRLADAEQALMNLSGQIGGVLEFGTSHHIGLHHLPPILRSYTARYPNVRLNPQFQSSEEVCRKVELGELEIGIVTLPHGDTPNLILEPVWEDPLVFVTATTTTINETISAKELVSIPAILPEYGTFTREMIDRALAKKQVTIEPALSTNYLETIKMLVSVGLGWSVLPASMLSADLKTVNVENICVVRRLGLVYHRRRTFSNAAKAMRDLLFAA